jgi:hypothetical protein
MKSTFFIILTMGLFLQTSAFGATFYCAANCHYMTSAYFAEAQQRECAGGLGLQYTDLVYSENSSMKSAVDSLNSQCSTLATNLAASKAGVTVPQDQGDGTVCTEVFSGESTSELKNPGNSNKNFSPIDDCRMAQ